ncbi:MAG TPA: FAD-dependent oxidoreductase, partial [Patescibacteria group bacterium]|nr:FAD-dependent oxidoreductase [Patescibacteria group bacterium]
MVAGDQSDPADVLILGGGPGGYVAAIRAAQLGRSVTLVERGRVGGVCLTEGCIPSKHLARFAAVRAAAAAFGPSGMPAFSGPPDMAAFQKSRAAAVDTLVKGVESLLDINGVKVIRGSARFVGRTRVCVELGEESVRYFDFKDVVIATGSRAAGAAESSDPSRALEYESVPATLLVAGDDYIALEIAIAYARLGSQVTIAVPGERLLPDFDSDLSAAALRGARSSGAKVVLNSAHVDGDWERTVVSAGRRPNLDQLDLAAAGISLPTGTFKVDPQLRVDRH